KVPPADRAPVTGTVDTIEELVTLLEEVRNDRPAGAANRPEVGGAAEDAGVPEGERVAPGGAPAVDPGQRGGGAEGEGGAPGSAEGVRGPRPADHDGRGGSGVPAGERAPRAGSRSRPASTEGDAPAPAA